MNKYQIQALLDIGKIVIAIVVGIAVFNGIIMLGLSATNVVGGISLAVMIYCIYQLFLIRVGQLESQDKDVK